MSQQRFGSSSAIAISRSVKSGGRLPALILPTPLILLASLPGPALAAQAQPVAPPVAAPAQVQPAFEEDDLVLLELSAGDDVLSDAFAGYSSRSGVYLPLGELSRLLDLSIFVAPPEARATGWVVTPDRLFELDLHRHSAASGTVKVDLGPADAVLYHDDIYVRADLLAKLLPIDFKADIGELTLKLHPRETLPFQASLERQRRAASIGTTESGGVVGAIDLPYELATPPAIDVNIDSGFSNRSPRRTLRYDARVGADLLYTGFQLFAGSDDHGSFDRLRMLFERKDPTGSGLAGPFGMTRSNVGDTFTPSLALGAQSSAGRGFAVTSEPLEQATIFNRTDLRGELALGYQVELYVNEVLRGSQLQPVEGRYEFLAVPLAYGVNVIRLVFYGPRGERRQEVRRLNVGGGQQPAGKLTFSLGVVQQGRALIDPHGAPDGIGMSDPGYGELRLVGRLAYGLSNTTTLYAGMARFTPRFDDSRLLGTLGLSTSLAGFSLQGDVAADDHGGAALAFAVAGRPAGISIIARHTEYRGGFIDEVQAGGALAVPLVRSTALRTDFAVPLGHLALPLALDLQRDQDNGGLTRISGSARTSLLVQRFLLSTAVNLQHESGPAGSHSLVTGGTDLSRTVAGTWQLRAAALYDLAPRLKLQAGSATVDRAIGDRMAMRLGVTRFFNTRNAYGLTAAATLRTHHAAMTFNTTYLTASHDVRFGLQFSFGTLFDPVARRYRVTPPGVAAGSSVAIDAFVDGNGNGRRDKGEAAVVGLPIASSARRVVTDADGHAIATGLGDGNQARVEADAAALEDPFVSVSNAVRRFTPRPGRVAVTHYAFTRSGEVTLKATFVAAGNSRGLSALSLRLVDAAGKDVAAGRTEFDGSLFLEGLKPGRYRVAIDTTQAERLHLTLRDPVELVVPSAGGYVGEVPLTVTELP
jgi:hypothetical protein